MSIRTTVVRGIAYFSYAPLLAVAATVTFGKLLVYAGLIGVEQFGLLGKMLLVSALFSFCGSLGLQSVASRELPALLARGRARRGIRLLAQTVAVTTYVCLLCVLAALSGLTPFGLTAEELVLGIAHGWAQSIFLSASFESRSRLEMMRYARDTSVRSLAAALAGLGAGAAGGGASGILVAEIMLTLALFAGVAAAALTRAPSPAASILTAVSRRLWALPWRASMLLLAGAGIAFASANLDRWIGAAHLTRQSFGQYSFAWVALLAAQSGQALLNAGVLPLISRRRAEALEASAFRLTTLISLTLFVGGLALVGPLVWATALSISHFLPQFGDAVPLLVPMMLAAVARLSDFWSSLLIVLEREALMLAGQSAALIIAAAGYAAWLLFNHAAPNAVSLAWLAFAAASLSHLAGASSACACLLRARRDGSHIERRS